MTERKRNLSGFGSSVPAPPPPPEPATTAPMVPAPGSSPRPAPANPKVRRLRPSAKKRVTLSLPVDTAAHLRAASEASRRYYLDIILDAYVRHSADIQREVDTARSASTVGVRPLKRRTTPGRVQVALLIPVGDLAQIDAAAHQAGLDRSSYVALLLDRT